MSTVGRSGEAASKTSQAIYKLTEDDRIDRRRRVTAYRKLGSLLIDVEDYAADLCRFVEHGQEIPHREMLAACLRDTSKAVNKALRVLR